MSCRILSFFSTRPSTTMIDETALPEKFTS